MTTIDSVTHQGTTLNAVAKVSTGPAAMIIKHEAKSGIRNSSRISGTGADRDGGRHKMDSQVTAEMGMPKPEV